MVVGAFSQLIFKILCRDVQGIDKPPANASFSSFTSFAGGARFYWRRLSTQLTTYAPARSPTPLPPLLCHTGPARTSSARGNKCGYLFVAEGIR